MSDRGEYRPIYSAIIREPDFQALSQDARMLWFVLKLSLGPSGIGIMYDDELRELSGVDDVESARNELVAGQWLVLEARIHWLRNGLRYEPNIRMSHEKHRTSIERHLASLPRLNIILDFASYYELTPPFQKATTVGLPIGTRKATPKPIAYRERERDREREPETEDGKGGPAVEPSVNLSDVRDGVGVLCERFVVAKGILGAMKHLGMWAGTKAGLNTRFLYPTESQGLPDQSVKGLEFDERVQIVAEALVEMQTKDRADVFDVPTLASFVRRLRNRPPPNSEADGIDPEWEKTREEMRRREAEAIESLNTSARGGMKRIAVDV